MTVEWRVPTGQVRSLTIALHSLISQIRGAHGSKGCSVSMDIRDEGLVRYTEEWETEADLRHRLECDTFKDLTALMDEATESPNVEFALPSGTRGLDFVEEAIRAIS
jgi:hypothetical protein